MFCPVCKAEYRKGFTRCSDCDVALVETLETANAAAPEQMNAVMLWSGTDSGAFVAVRDALDWAKIFHFAQSRESGVFPNLKGQPYSIFVNKEDYPAAEAVLQTVPVAVETADTEDEQNSEDLPEESNDLKESDSDEPVPDDITEDFQPDDATAEIWSGDDRDLAEMFRMSLRENGIGCVVDGSGGKNIVRVMPEFERRAKEIVREILEGTPPN
jgi:hypothetical protein